MNKHFVVTVALAACSEAGPVGEVGDAGERGDGSGAAGGSAGAVESNGSGGVGDDGSGGSGASGGSPDASGGGSGAVGGLEGAGPQQAKLFADDGAEDDEFGGAVALSGDTALVGATGADDNGTNSGAAYVFVRSDSSWTQQAKLLANDGEVDTIWATGDTFGFSVALSGETALVGAPYTTVEWDLRRDSGAAYVFVRSGSSWQQQAQLLPDEAGQGDSFGISVSLSGETALVGARYGDQLVYSGAAYVFERSGSSWQRQATLLAADGVSGGFGDSVSLSGETALVGAPGDDDNGIDSGAAYVFVRSGSSWQQQAKLLPADGVERDFFGRSVSLNGDTALIGATGADENGDGFGAAYVFVRSGSSWTQQAKLLAADALSGSFGQSVSLSGDTALVGGSTNLRDAYVFERSGSAWQQQQKLLPADRAEYWNLFGSPVSLSGDTALVGAWADDEKAQNSGAAYVFDLSVQ